jgi:hypothetical protein
MPRVKKKATSLVAESAAGSNHGDPSSAVKGPAAAPIGSPGAEPTAFEQPPDDGPWRERNRRLYSQPDPVDAPTSDSPVWRGVHVTDREAVPLEERLAWADQVNVSVQVGELFRRDELVAMWGHLRRQIAAALDDAWAAFGATEAAGKVATLDRVLRESQSRLEVLQVEVKAEEAAVADLISTGADGSLLDLAEGNAVRARMLAEAASRRIDLARSQLAQAEEEAHGELRAFMGERLQAMREDALAADRRVGKKVIKALAALAWEGAAAAARRGVLSDAYIMEPWLVHLPRPAGKTGSHDVIPPTLTSPPPVEA